MQYVIKYGMRMSQQSEKVFDIENTEQQIKVFQW